MSEHSVEPADDDVRVETPVDCRGLIEQLRGGTGVAGAAQALRDEREAAEFHEALSVAYHSDDRPAAERIAAHRRDTVRLLEKVLGRRR